MRKFILAVFFLLLCRTGFAQTPEEVKAHGLYMKAREFYEKAQYLEAIKLLDEAYSLFPLPLILMKKAECYEKTGEIEEALTIYKSLESESVDPKIKSRVDKKVKELTSLISMPVELTVVTNVPDVEVVIDAFDVFTTPFTVKITRGKHTFQFKKKGYKTINTDYIVKGASPLIYRVDMEEARGKVVITTDLENFSGINVLIDNNPVEIHDSFRTQRETDPYDIQVGIHTLTCSKNGGKSFITTFEVVEDGLVHANCKLREYEAKDKTLGWVAVGGAIVSAGLGTYLVISYYNDKNKAKETGMLLESNKQYFGPAFIGLGVASGILSYFLLTGGDGEEVAGIWEFEPRIFALDRGLFLSASGRF